LGEVRHSPGPIGIAPPHRAQGTGFPGSVPLANREYSPLVRARTLTMLDISSPDRKPRVLEFLIEMELIQTVAPDQQPVISLKFADLHEIDMVNRDLLTKTDLDRANLNRAKLTDANLSNANLPKAHLFRAKLERTILTDANLQKAFLIRTDLEGADLTGADLRGADLTGAQLRSADLRGAKYDAETSWPQGFDPEASEAVAD
jgi:hypothetical protein